MRIGLVAGEPEIVSDWQPYLESAVGALTGAGHEVRVVFAGPSAFGVEAWGAQVHPARLDLPRAIAESLPFEGTRSALAVYHTLLKLDAVEPFDYVEFPDHDGLGYFALHGKRYLAQFRKAVFGVRARGTARERDEANADPWLDLRRAEIYHRERVALRLADVVFVSGEAAARHLAQGGVAAEVLAEPLLPRQPLPRRPSQADPLICCLGTLEPRRAPLELAAALRAVRESGCAARLRFVGEDSATGPHGRSMLEYLRGRIPLELRGAVEFAGGTREGLERALAEAAVCCVASRGPYWPRECVEAMARGCPVVVRADTGAAELAGEAAAQFGDSPSTLAEVLRSAVEGDPDRQRWGERAASRVAQVCDPQAYARDLAQRVAAVRQRLGADRAARPVKRAPASPAVTVVVPYFNLGAYLPATLESIARQTYPSLEAVVVNDGSTDPASVALLERIESPRVRVINKANEGLCSARNTGLRAARGRWVLPLDADDLIAPTFVEKTVAALEADPQLSFASTLVTYFTRSPDRPEGGWIPWGDERDLLVAVNIASTCSAMFRRDHLEACGGYDEWLTSFEDWDLLCSLAERGYRGVILPEFLFHYRYRPDSLTRTEVKLRRNRLRAYLIRKHRALAEHPDVPLRILLSEIADLQTLVLQPPQIRYRIADTLNDALKRSRVHAVARAALKRLYDRRANKR